MTRVVCGVGESSATLDAVPAAVAFCRGNGADLELVGLVKDTLSDSTGAGAGNKILRYKQVKFELDRAAEAVREGGLSPRDRRSRRRCAERADPRGGGRRG